MEDESGEKEKREEESLETDAWYIDQSWEDISHYQIWRKK